MFQQDFSLDHSTLRFSFNARLQVIFTELVEKLLSYLSCLIRGPVSSVLSFSFSLRLDEPGMAWDLCTGFLLVYITWKNNTWGGVSFSAISFLPASCWSVWCPLLQECLHVSLCRYGSIISYFCQGFPRKQ